MCNELFMKADDVKYHYPVMKLVPTNSWHGLYTVQFDLVYSDRYRYPSSKTHTLVFISGVHYKEVIL